eukprot:294304-Pyramimonas_sp.AAC.1
MQHPKTVSWRNRRVSSSHAPVGKTKSLALLLILGDCVVLLVALGWDVLPQPSAPPASVRHERPQEAPCRVTLVGDTLRGVRASWRRAGFGGGELVAPEQLRPQQPRRGGHGWRAAAQRA